MSEPQMDRQARHRLAVLRHVEEVTGSVAMTCRYFGISRQTYYDRLRRYETEGVDGLRDRDRSPRTSASARPRSPISNDVTEGGEQPPPARSRSLGR